MLLYGPVRHGFRFRHQLMLVTVLEIPVNHFRNQFQQNIFWILPCFSYGFDGTNDPSYVGQAGIALVERARMSLIYSS